MDARFEPDKSHDMFSILNYWLNKLLQ